jgi:hypothetical protein
MRPPNAPDSPPMKGATPHPTGWCGRWGSAIAGAPGVGGWRRRLIRQGGIAGALAALGGVFRALWRARRARLFVFAASGGAGRQTALINPFSMPQPPHWANG